MCSLRAPPSRPADARFSTPPVLLSAVLLDWVSLTVAPLAARLGTWLADIRGGFVVRFEGFWPLWAPPPWSPRRAAATPDMQLAADFRGALGLGLPTA